MKPVAITVSELNKYIKDKVDGDEYLNNVYVKGEISNFKHHYTGHMYFTLKDEKSLIKCVMFKSSTPTLNFVPKDGMKVFVFGTLSVYEAGGVYQIYCKAMQEDGVGDLYKKYEELKRRLEEEGLFDNAHKKKIPIMPKTIGVLTSQTGAVIRDIINVSTRRNPNVNIKLYPIPVQGKGAEYKIAEAIRIMNENKIADVIILARGGGSLEDLWPFNEEIVAREIYESDIPIISAVGHETDFTIADFVADLRAPTPSAAAELAQVDIYDIKRKIETYKDRYKQALKKKTEVMRLRYEKAMASRVFTDPLKKVNENYIGIDMKVKRIQTTIQNILKTNRTKAESCILKLDTLSPLKTLARGYSIAEHNGKILRTTKQIKENDEISVRLEDGKLIAKVGKILWKNQLYIF